MISLLISLRRPITRLLMVLIAGPVLAQKPPFSATMTNPSSQHVKFDPNQKTGNSKIPALNLPCKLSNGEDRPFPCEFRLDRIVLYKNGILLGQVTPTSNTITLPYATLSNSSPAVTIAIAVDARFFFTRINPPNFPETNLLLAQVNHSLNDKVYKPSDAGLSTVAKVLVGQQVESIVLPLVWPVDYKGEKQLQFSAELYAYLPATRDKLKAKYGATLSLKDQSEASMLLNLKLTYE